MPGLPFVLADKDRIAQFALLARTRQLFRDCEFWNDGQGLTWASRRIGDHCFAVSLLGPGWVFDDYARQARAEDLAARRAALEQVDTEERRRQLDEILARLQFGAVTERVLWAVHQRVMQAKSSVVRIPDRLLAQAVWGQDDTAWPRHWRTTIAKSLASLAWLHLAAWPQEGPPVLDDHSALITHSADLRRSANDGCDDDCPLLHGSRHKHFTVNIGRGFLGVLEQFARVNSPGVRSYDLKLSDPRGSGPTLKSVGKSGKLTTLYLPAKLGPPSVCANFTPKQQGLLQAIVRETSRRTKGKPREVSQAEVFPGNQIPGIQRKKSIVCGVLAPDGNYVGFNGNRKLKGLGYGLTTPGGWLFKAGYARDDLENFFNDLAALAGPLGLIAVGIHVPTRECLGLERLQALAGSVPGRQTLAQTHLRLYTSADYVQCWNDYFGWTALPAVERGGDLAAEMTRKGITKAALARGIGVGRSFLSRVFAENKPWPAQLLARAHAWVAATVSNTKSAERP
jgi:hypothetical protein